MSREEIQALIHLLDDPNQEVNRTVTRNLLDQGMDILPDLEDAWERTRDTDHQERLISLIQEIQTTNTLSMIKGWVAGGASDLLQGAYLIARFQYPDLRIQDIENPLDRIIRDVWLELNNNLTALEKIRILNHIFFEINGFGRSTRNFYNPGNSYVNQVLQTRKGNPISLAVIYAVVSRKLGLPVYGVNLPKNFLLAYKDEPVVGEDFSHAKEEILFYINPYNKGEVLGRKEIDYFLKQHGIAPKPSHYLPCHNLDIIVRILHNLIHACHKSGYPEKAELYKGILKTILPSG